jgi:hypothetical protein
LAPADAGSVLVWRLEVAPLLGEVLLLARPEQWLAVVAAQQEGEAVQVLSELFGAVGGVADECR